MQAELRVFRVEEGLGNACALVLPDGTLGIIDWGTARDEPLQQLLALAQRAARPRVRFVAATHPHADHTLGLAPLLSRLLDASVAVDRLVYPTAVGGLAEDHLRRVRFVAADRKVPMSSISVATLPQSLPAPVLALGVDPEDPACGWIVRVLAPIDTDLAAQETRDQRATRLPGNPTSLVVQFAFTRNELREQRGCAILPGDATAATLNGARRRAQEFPELNLANDALVIPHHGSHHNWVPWFADALLGVAIVSAPSGRDKHPSPAVLREVLQVCGSGEHSRLLCTSYAGACHRAYGAESGAPGRLEPCFGDISVALSPQSGARLIAHDERGPSRRSFGLCGR